MARQTAARSRVRASIDVRVDRRGTSLVYPMDRKGYIAASPTLRMKPLSFVLALCIAAAPVGAQSIRGAVLAKREPHHHLAYEDSVVRVLRVRVPAHDTTLLHEHDPDYFWIALGPSEVINAKPGLPDATITSPDLSVHYTPGKFAHVARNPGDTPFDNITVELLEPQRSV